MTIKICFIEKEDPRVQEATQLLTDIEIIFADSLEEGFLLLKENKVDGLIAGAVYTTKDIIKHALKTIPTKDQFASSYFLMKKGDQEFLFADCGFNIKPNAKQLAKIALQTAESAKKLSLTPKIAFLSYSTKGSAQGETTTLINEAIQLVKKENPELLVDGELQVDAAIRPEVAGKKCPDSPLKGNANIFIFPDLNAGNIGYKLLKELGGFQAIGPLFQGFEKPIHDLSRGCCVKEIVESAQLMKRTLLNKDA